MIRRKERAKARRASIMNAKDRSHRLAGFKLKMAFKTRRLISFSSIDFSFFELKDYLGLIAILTFKESGIFFFD